jgi:DNA-binding XRE family transcriptional regulator
MKIEGKLIKSGKWWAVEIPLLLIHTQGRTKKAYEMATDAVEAIIEEKGFKVTITEGTDNIFSIGSNNDCLLMALALKQQRTDHHLSVRDVAKRIGSDSPSAYSRYEQGKVKPSLDKFSQLLKAIDPRLEPILKVV